MIWCFHWDRFECIDLLRELVAFPLHFLATPWSLSHHPIPPPPASASSFLPSPGAAVWGGGAGLSASSQVGFMKGVLPGEMGMEWEREGGEGVEAGQRCDFRQRPRR